jgi:glycosyltransferase involved in cell wall biosynthesis
MLHQQRVAVVVPCFNEERQITGVIASMPAAVDAIVVVDDASTDKTISAVQAAGKNDPRVTLLRHVTNQGVGGAIASGYKFARDKGYDIAVVMAGDGQMAPEDFGAVVGPVALGEVDYTKGNRLVTHGAFKQMPTSRFIGNAILSFLTKIASGYWHIADSQSGYTALGRIALHTLDWDIMYKRYGQPNDLLVRLNVYNFRVRDIPMPPIYGRGEVSKMKKRKVVFTLSWLLVKLFLWRLKEKYVVRDFHPLVFFWALTFLLFPASLGLLARLVYFWSVNGNLPAMTALAFGFCFISAMQSMCFALLFDMEANRHLR